MGEFIVVFEGLDADEGQGEEDGAGVKELETAKLVHLARGPGHDGSDAGGDEDNRVGRADGNVEPTVGPVAFGSAHAQQDVGGKQGAEEHDFGAKEQPNADLGVVEAGVLAGLDDVGEDFRHEKVKTLKELNSEKGTRVPYSVKHET